MKTLLTLSLGFCVLALAPLKDSAPHSGIASGKFTLQPLPMERHHKAAPHIPQRNGTSSNWSGYGVPTAKGAVTGVAGSWTVTSVSRSTSANTYSSFWVGIDGYNSKTVEQIGTEADWTPNGPSYYAWFEMYPKFAYKIVGFPVAPGDVINGSVTYNGTRGFTLSIQNVTQNVSYSITQKANANLSSAEWVAEAPYSGGVLPLANFGTVPFSGCVARVNGVTSPIGAFSSRDPITMTTSSGAVKAQPSVLSTDGTSFNVTWYHE